MDNLIVKNVFKKNDNTLWTPEQMLEHVLNQLEAGIDKADSAIVILIENVPNRRVMLSWYQANVKQELLTHALERVKIHSIVDDTIETT